MLPSGPRLVQRKWPIHYILYYTGCHGSPCNKFNYKHFFYFSLFLQIRPSRVKIKYNLNPKIHTRSCVYTSIDNEARKKITRMENSKNC
jgi:hypothetical protein